MPLSPETLILSQDDVSRSGSRPTFSDHAVPAFAHGEASGGAVHLQQQLHAVHRRCGRSAHCSRNPCSERITTFSACKFEVLLQGLSSPS